MRSAPVFRLLAAGAATMLVLSACGFVSGSDDSDDGSAPGEVTVPEGGWPQPVNGQLTEDMCQLLTPADYSAVGHDLVIPLEPQGETVSLASNAVSCLAPPADALTLILQPTAEAAQVWFESAARSSEGALESEGGEPVRAEDVVPGADESWFDYWLAVSDGEFQDYELVARRGALILELTISVEKAETPDPQGVLVALAELVLERLPEVGTTDTGTTPTATLQVNGTGPASSIEYTVDEITESLEDVALPWSVEVPMADRGQAPVFLNLFAQTEAAGGIGAPIACAISVDGTVVLEQESVLLVICNTQYTPE